MESESRAQGNSSGCPRLSRLTLNRARWHQARPTSTKTVGEIAATARQRCQRRNNIFIRPGWAPPGAHGSLLCWRGHLALRAPGPPLRGRRVSGVAATGLGRDGSRAYARSAPSGALLAPPEMLVIERKRGSRCIAGSGGMQQPDRPSAGGVRLLRLRERGSVRLVRRRASHRRPLLCRCLQLTGTLLAMLACTRPGRSGTSSLMRGGRVGGGDFGHDRGHLQELGSTIARRWEGPAVRVGTMFVSVPRSVWRASSRRGLHGQRGLRRAGCAC